MNFFFGQTGGADLCPSATYSSGLRGYSSSSRYSPHLRRSLPNMLHPHHPHHQDQPPKIYPAHLLFTTNYRLPNDVDRCHLEVSLHHFNFKFKKIKTKFKKVKTKFKNRNFKFKILKSKFKNSNFKFKKLKTKFKNRNFKFKKRKSEYEKKVTSISKKLKCKSESFLLTWYMIMKVI